MKTFQWIIVSLTALAAVGFTASCSMQKSGESGNSRAQEYAQIEKDRREQINEINGKYGAADFSGPHHLRWFPRQDRNSALIMGTYDDMPACYRAKLMLPGHIDMKDVLCLPQRSARPAVASAPAS